MHRSTAASKDASRESVVDKVFVEADFFTDTPDKTRRVAEPCHSEVRDVKVVRSGSRPCLPDRGPASNTEIHTFERNSGKDSGKSTGIFSFRFQPVFVGKKHSICFCSR